MSSRDHTVWIFIDYDNLLPNHKTGGILQLVTRALIQLPVGSVARRARCDVRVYGGWYEGALMTRLAQELAVELQRDFPAVIRLAGGEGTIVPVATNAELAVALIQEPGHHLFNTYRRKGKPANVRVAEPHAIGCSDTSCVLPLMKRLLKTGTCPKAGCVVSSEQVLYRHEQKIVDTMLSCDLIHAISVLPDNVILVSGDDDFLPPLRVLLLGGTSVIRFHPKLTHQYATFPPGTAQLIELEL